MGDDGDVVGVAEIDKIGLWLVGVSLDLDDCGLDRRRIEDRFQLRPREVTDAECLRPAALDDRLKVCPRLSQRDRRRFDLTVGVGRKRQCLLCFYWLLGQSIQRPLMGPRFGPVEHVAVEGVDAEFL